MKEEKHKLPRLCNKETEQLLRGMEVILVLLLFLCFYDIVAAQNTQNDRKIALTFDDGPHPIYTEMLLDGLRERGVKVTFFVVGENAKKYPELIRKMDQDGHLIGNHTYTHMALNTQNATQFEQEILMTNRLLKEITGKDVQYVRPPYGLWKKSYEEKWNLLPILWNIDPRDWSVQNTDKIVQHVVGRAEDFGIILLHDSYKTSVESALQIIDILRQQGYEFVTVDEML